MFGLSVCYWRSGKESLQSLSVEPRGMVGWWRQAERRREDESPEGQDVDSVHDSRSRRARNNHNLRGESDGHNRR